MNDIHWIPLVIVLLAAVIAAVTDVWKFRVYNALTIPLFLSGLLFHLVNSGWSGLGGSLAGAAFGFFVLIFPYALGLMGAGDVKLLAGVGAWMGLIATAQIFAVSSLVAGVYAIALILIRGELADSWRTTKSILLTFAMLGSKSGKEDLVSSLAVDKQRRLRVIPFGAMVPFGVVGAGCWIHFLR
ncbi:MAG: prepilin peptidase [Planctomycetales bacterium]|nr:prepilin peptidase [Planctomycetales bacterium]